MNYEEFCNLKSNNHKENIFPKGTTKEDALNIVFNYLISPNEILYNYPAHTEQDLTEKVGYILSNYESFRFKQYSLLKRLFLKLKCYIFNEPLYKYF